MLAASVMGEGIRAHAMTQCSLESYHLRLHILVQFNTVYHDTVQYISAVKTHQTMPHLCAHVIFPCALRA